MKNNSQKEDQLNERLQVMIEQRRQIMLQTFSTAMDINQIKSLYFQSFLFSQPLAKHGEYSKYDYLIHLEIDKHFGFEVMTHISNLKLEQDFTDYVIELQIAHEPFYGQAYHLLTQNSTGIIPVSVYDCDFDSSYYQPGNKIIIFNPYLRFGNNFSPFIKITSKNDIIFLPSNVTYESWQKSKGFSSQQLKELGNKFYQNGRYRRAIQIYKMALFNTDSTQKQIIWANLSQSFIKQGDFKNGLASIKQALKFDSTNQKYLLRQIKCLINLHEDCSELLEKIEDSVEKNNLRKERIILQQQESGIYNYYELLQNSQIINEYIGPIEIEYLGNVGRGVVATQEIISGQLIMAEKAFSINNHAQSFQHELEQQFIYQTHPANIPMIRATQIEMLNYNYKAKQLLKLFNGKNSLEPLKIKDLKGRILENDEKINFDFETVDRIIKLNECECWSLDKVINAIKNGGPLSKEELHNKGEYKSALWLILSMMNHSCCPNTIRFSIKDYIFLIAKENIKKGEEIYTTYIPTFIPYDKKQHHLQEWYQFRCSCKGCKKYEKLPQESKIMFKQLGIHLEKSQNLIRIENIYQKIEDQNEIPEMMDIQLQMMKLASQQNDETLLERIWKNYKVKCQELEDIVRVRSIMHHLGKKSGLWKEYENISKKICQFYYGDKELKLYKKYIE